MNTNGMTINQWDAMQCLVRRGWIKPSSSGLSVQTYRALVRRGLLVHTGGSGNDSTYALTDDGRQWVTEYI